MKSKKVSKINIIFFTVTAIIIVAIIVLLAIALPGAENNVLPTSSPDSTDNDEFDPNNVVIRNDPVIITVHDSGIKFSEFNYFYYISANEVINGLDYPENATDEQKTDIIKDALNNGIDGESFDDIIFEKAKDYVIKYFIYRKDYIDLGYEINESFKLYLQSNYLYAEDMDDLNEKNESLLEAYGVVRNEYIDILVYNEMISSYREYIKKNAEYTEEELKKEYEENKEMFSYKGIRAVILNSGEMETAIDIKEKIDSGYDMISLVEDYSVSSTKSLNKGLFEGADDSFNDIRITEWLGEAKLNETKIFERENEIYIVRYENDGSFEKRKDDVKNFKCVFDYDNSIESKINDGIYDIVVNANIIAELERPSFLKVYE